MKQKCKIYLRFLLEEFLASVRTAVCQLPPFVNVKEIIMRNVFPYRSSFDKLQLTHEQVRIIKHDVKVGEIIKIVAFAGKNPPFLSMIIYHFCNWLTGREFSD